jgi:hypothetical protein
MSYRTRRLTALIATAPLIVVGLQVANVAPSVADPEQAPVHATYRGIRPDDPRGQDPLLNPHRGLRLEMFFNAKDLTNPFQSGSGRVDVAKTVEDHEAQFGAGTRVSQVYFYLHDYVGTDITPRALGNMQSVFNRLRDLGYSVVLRFSYDDAVRANRCYGVADIQRHLAQLKPLLDRNAGLITTWQAGFLGAWGEWGPNCTNIQQHPDQVNTLMNSIMATAPAGVPVMMRYPFHRNMISDPAIRAKVGFHNDFFTAGYESCCDYYTPDRTTYWNGDTYPGNFFDEVVAASPNVAVDGEMGYDIGWGVSCPEGDPWCFNTPLDGITSAKRLQTMHYTTFSEVHHYRVTFRHWREQQLSQQQVAEAGLPFDPTYFHNGDGTGVTRSALDYIRDHLGYRIRLTDATYGANDGDQLPVTVNLVNDGFSAPHTPRTTYLVLLDAAGNIVAKQATDADWTSWQGLGSTETNAAPRTTPTHTVQGTLKLAGLAKGNYRIGLWLPASHRSLQGDPKYAVRVANGAVSFTSSGVNVIGSIQVK